MVKRRSKSYKGKSRKDRYISGKTGLSMIDGAVSRARTSLEHAVRSADETAQRRGDVRRDQVKGFQALAKFRLEKLKLEDDIGELSEAEQKAQDLLEQHADFIAREYDALQEMTEAIEELETERTDAHKTLSELVAIQQEKIEALLATLAETPAYQSLENALEEAAAISDRALQKLELAKIDRQEKGVPYEADPLFSYLWARKYRTTNYKARGVARMLDGWVGMLCGYDKAHLTYARLTELPDRLDEHLVHVEGLEDEAEAALKSIEAKALREGGIEEMEAEAEKIREAIRGLDTRIEAAEETHLTRTERHTNALRADTGPAEKARRVLAEALRKMSFPDLRVLVAQTVELEDDEIVDELVRLRAEEMQLDLEMTDQTTLPDRRRRDLKQIEALRKGYKRASYASDNLLIDQSVLEDVISDLHSDALNLDKALKRIRKTIRRASRDRDGRGGSGGYGGKRHRSSKRSRRHRRYDTAYGWEDIAATVVVELAKGALSSGSSYRGNSRRRRSSGGGRSRGGGGFKTGDRF